MAQSGLVVSIASSVPQNRKYDGTRGVLEKGHVIQYWEPKYLFHDLARHARESNTRAAREVFGRLILTELYAWPSGNCVGLQIRDVATRLGLSVVLVHCLEQQALSRRQVECIGASAAFYNTPVCVAAGLGYQLRDRKGPLSWDGNTFVHGECPAENGIVGATPLLWPVVDWNLVFEETCSALRVPVCC